MEPFGGSLAHYRLQLLVPALLRAPPLSGRLILERGPERREFTVHDGRVVGLSSSVPGEHLGQVLADQGVLSASEAAEAFEAAGAAGCRVAEWLVSGGKASEAQLACALEWRTRLALLECYSWESGELTVIPEAPTGTPAFPVALPLAELHRDAVDALPGWRRFRTRFVRLDGAVEVVEGGGPVPPELVPLVALAFTGAPVSRLLATRDRDPQEAAQGLLALHAAGLLRPAGHGFEAVDLEACMREARHQLERGHAAEAARLAHRALESGPVPEASALYRQAAAVQARNLDFTLGRVLPRLRFREAPAFPPPGVTADDLFVLSRLGRSLHPVGEAHALPMGPRALLRSLQRLAAAGLVAAAV
jgi:hypothetical protein